MAVVGTEIGQVHNLNQGEGLATTFGAGNRALDTYDQLSAEKRAVGRAKEAQKQAQMDAGLKRMLDFNPDRWFKHEQVIKGELNNWMTEGSKLMAGGINPWTSTDPQSLEWRKKQIEIQGLAEGSKQVKDWWVSNRTKLDGAEPGKFTPASTVDAADYADMDIRDIVNNRVTPPLLMQTKPMLQLQDHFSKTVSAVNQTRNGNPLTEADKWDIAKKSIDDPKTGSDLTDSFRSMFAQMDQSSKDDVRRRAQANGVSEMQQLGKDYVDRYATERKPFDFGEWKADALNRIKVPYKEWRGSENFSKKVDKAELQRIASTVARDVFNNDDRALQEYEKVLPKGEGEVVGWGEQGGWMPRDSPYGLVRKPGETDGSYKQRAVKHLTDQLISETATQEEAGQTASGREKQDYLVSQKIWREDIMSPDPKKNKEAIGFLMSAPGIFPGLTVQNGAIYEDVPGQRELKLYLAGNLEYADVKKVMNRDGLMIEENQVEPRSTNTVITVPITFETENWLDRLHDHAFKDTKISYKGSGSETKPLTLSQIAKGQKPVIAPTNQKFDF